MITSHENYFPGDDYDNAMVGATVELLGFIAGGTLYEKLGARRTFFFMYILAAVSAIGVLAISEESNPGLDLLSSYIARFAISATYQAIYLVMDLFPILFASTIFGACNVFAGITNLGSAVFYPLSDNEMVGIFIALALVIGFVSLMLVENKKKL